MSLPDAIAPGGTEIAVRDLGRVAYDAALADTWAQTLFAQKSALND